jgi:hypothetical protein
MPHLFVARWLLLCLGCVTAAAHHLVEQMTCAFYWQAHSTHLADNKTRLDSQLYCLTLNCIYYHLYLLTCSV